MTPNCYNTLISCPHILLQYIDLIYFHLVYYKTTRFPCRYRQSRLHRPVRAGFLGMHTHWRELALPVMCTHRIMKRFDSINMAAWSAPVMKHDNRMGDNQSILMFILLISSGFTFFMTISFSINSTAEWIIKRVEFCGNEWVHECSRRVQHNIITFTWHRPKN